MKSIKPVYVLLTGFLLCGTGVARDIDGHFAVLGAGGNSCGKYLAARSDKLEYQREYVNWLTGYFSAFNQIVASTYNVLGETTPDEALRQLDAWCLNRENELFISATAAITRQLFESRANLSPNPDHRTNWTDLGKISD